MLKTKIFTIKEIKEYLKKGFYAFYLYKVLYIYRIYINH